MPVHPRRLKINRTTDILPACTSSVTDCGRNPLAGHVPSGAAERSRPGCAFSGVTLFVPAKDAEDSSAGVETEAAPAIHRTEDGWRGLLEGDY